MRSDFDAAATRKMIVREGLATLAHATMLPFGLIRSRHAPLRQKDLRTLVFVHGLGANRATFYPMQFYLRHLGYDRQLAVNHRSNPSIEALAVQLKRRIDAEVKGGRIDIIAHSLGGLIARVYLQMLGGDRRVDRLITLGTPHRGTYASTFIPNTLIRQLHPDSPFIQHLNGLPAPNVRAWSLCASNDLLVQPASSAACPFGEVRPVPGIGHNGILLAPRVFKTIRHALQSHAEVD